MMPGPITLDYQTYLKFLATPFITIFQLVLNLFLDPLQSIILTIGYLRFNKEIKYPALPGLENIA
jgi:hypothetical protein